MQTSSVLDGRQHLVIQPSDSEIASQLKQLEFQPVPGIPQLMYLPVNKVELDQVFQSLHDVASPDSKARSRFTLLKAAVTEEESNQLLSPQRLLTELLQAHPLSVVTEAIKDAWFMHILLEQKIYIAYQPIVDLKLGKITAYECLARAQNDEGATFTGQQLIDAAVSTNLIYEFDQMARTISVNSIAEVSQGQTFLINVLPNALINNPQAFEYNCQRVMELGLKPEQIIWELTEVEVLVNRTELIPLIEKVQNWGFGIAVDDLFSSSATSEHYVMEFCPTLLKLDRHIVHGCSRHAVRQVLVKSLMESAHNLGIKVLAEGLEDEKDIEYCRQLGIDYAQGYALGRPAPMLVS
jgi:EAL domain-containing protein (putative c-di-GMP-specific phosphodiesterase class I)